MLNHGKLRRKLIESAISHNHACFLYTVDVTDTIQASKDSGSKPNNNFCFHYKTVINNIINTMKALIFKYLDINIKKPKKTKSPFILASFQRLQNNSIIYIYKFEVQ